MLKLVQSYQFEWNVLLWLEKMNKNEKEKTKLSQDRKHKIANEKRGELSLWPL